MIFHHIIVIYIHLGGYLVNPLEVGILGFFLHDFTDITISTPRALSETNSKYPIVILFILNIFFWIHMRLIMFPWLIYVSYVGDHKIEEPLIMGFF